MQGPSRLKQGQRLCPVLIYSLPKYSPPVP
jgi:hypothetical protein